MAVDRNKIFQNAEKYVRQGKIDQAIALYEQLVQANPRDMNLKNRVGDLLIQANTVPEAVKVYREVAEFYADEGFYLKAIAIYKKINKYDPASVDSYFKLAELYSKQGLNNDAKSQYQQVAELYAKQGDQAKASEALEHLVRLEPENIKVRVRLAELYQKLGQTPKAVEEYQAVGAGLAKKGMLEEAVKIYEKGLAESDESPTLVAGLCKSLLALSRNDELIDRAKGYYARNRENAGMLSALGEAYTRTGQIELARQVIEKLVALEPENDTWKQRLGELSSDRRPTASSAPAPAASSARPGGALPDFSEMTGDYSMEELEEVSGEWGAADLAPDVAAAGGPPGESSSGAEGEREEFIGEHMTEAEVFIKYGLVEKAIENLEAIVNRFPEEVECLKRLKDLYLETGNKPKAAEKCVELARIAKLKNDMPRALDLLAEARAHDPRVKVDRPAAASGGDEAQYSFGGGDSGFAVDLDSGPPTSGVELEFDAAGSGEVPASGTSLDFGEAQSTDAIELNFDEPHSEEASAIDLDLDDSSTAASDPEEGDLAEIDFYAEGGFTDEARSRLEAMRKRHPRSRKVLDRLERLGGTREEGPGEDEVAVAATGGGDEGIEFFENAIRAPRRDGAAAAGSAEASDESLFEQENEFLTEASEAPSAAESPSGGGVGEDSLEEIFKEFKKGVEAQLDTEDYETHYNLGIAYREMGLVDEAIAEFQLASKDVNRLVDCCSNLGLCFREKGMPKLAVKWYTKAIETLSEDGPQYVAVSYDLGEASEEAGDKEKALEFFVTVFGLDPNFRDIAEKIRKLEE